METLAELQAERQTAWEELKDWPRVPGELRTPGRVQAEEKLHWINEKIYRLREVQGSE